MADTKITALTAISTVDPAVDVLPIVDVSDTTMAASGTTKKITSNQILGAGGTATLASATITGDLTVDTSTLKVDSANNGVGIGTATPTSYGAGYSVLEVAGSTTGVINVKGGSTVYGQVSTETNILKIDALGASSVLKVLTNSVERYRIDNTGISTWYVGGSTAMTLDSTGLGVGGSPTSKLSIFAGADGDVGFFRGGSTRQLQLGTSATAGYLNVDNGSAGFELRVNGVARVYADTSGNVGIGVSPSYNLDVRAAAATANVQSSTGTNAVSIVARNTGGSFTLGKENSVGGGSGVFGQDAYASVLWSTGAYPVVFGTNGAHRLQIDSAGNMIPIIQTTAPTLTLNGQMVFNLTSDTNLRISVRGTDGVTRTANITLA